MTTCIYVYIYMTICIQYILYNIDWRNVTFESNFDFMI